MPRITSSASGFPGNRISTCLMIKGWVWITISSPPPRQPVFSCCPALRLFHTRAQTRQWVQFGWKWNLFIEHLFFQPTKALKTRKLYVLKKRCNFWSKRIKKRAYSEGMMVYSCSNISDKKKRLVSWTFHDMKCNYKCLKKKNIFLVTCHF